MQLRSVKEFIPLLLLALPSIAFAHARLTPGSAIVPRNDRDDLKSAPCGGAPKKAVQSFAPGSEVTLRWEETIEHPGWYEIRISRDGADFSNRLLKKDDDKNSRGDLPHTYEARVTLPNYECDSCVLQFIQVMTDRSPPTNYYSCADVRLSASVPPSPGGNVGTAPPPGSPLPGPSGTPTAAPVAPTRGAAPTSFKIEWRKEAP